jgi:hypothetical protein
MCWLDCERSLGLHSEAAGLDRSEAEKHSAAAEASRCERPGQTKDHRLSSRFERFRAAY